jgi:hypothetical protein
MEDDAFDREREPALGDQSVERCEQLLPVALNAGGWLSIEPAVNMENHGA